MYPRVGAEGWPEAGGLLAIVCGRSFVSLSALSTLRAATFFTQLGLDKRRCKAPVRAARASYRWAGKKSDTATTCVCSAQAAYGRLESPGRMMGRRLVFLSSEVFPAVL